LRASSLGFITAIFLISIQGLSVVTGQTTGNSSISGTIYCQTGCSAVGLSAGAPVNVAGKVQAVMIMALDPTNCAQRPDWPWTNGQPNEQTTFDSSAQGHYTLQNLLPGIYDVYASADGFQLTLITPNHITLCSGQSISQDGYLLPIGVTPEFPSATTLLIVVVLALVAVSLITKRRTKKFSTSAF